MIKLCPECGKKFTFEVKRCGDCGTRLVTITITEDPLIGLTIDDRFTITDRIAAGGDPG